MEVTTTVGDTRPNAELTTAANTQGRHGDVDKNGDLVDLATELRLLAAITATTPADEDDQLHAVKRLLRFHGFEEVPS